MGISTISIMLYGKDNAVEDSIVETVDENTEKFNANTQITDEIFHNLIDRVRNREEELGDYASNYQNAIYSSIKIYNEIIKTCEIQDNFIDNFQNGIVDTKITSKLSGLLELAEQDKRDTAFKFVSDEIHKKDAFLEFGVLAKSEDSHVFEMDPFDH